VLRRERVTLLGTGIDRIERADVARWLERFMLSSTPHQIITANLDFIAIARRKPEFARLMAGADLVVCDGKPLQWASQIQGEPIPARVTGMDLVLTAAQLSAETGYRLYFMGGAPGVAARAATALEALIPGVVMVGTDSPQIGHFDAEEDRRIVTSIQRAEPNALFVALGAPRQDEWIASHLDELGVPLCAGIGGVFNFLAGETKRAPEWMQQAGLEWTFRLFQEPSRLWKRYLVDDLPIFFYLITRQASSRLFGSSSVEVESHAAVVPQAHTGPVPAGRPAGTPVARRSGGPVVKHARVRQPAQPYVRSRTVRRPVTRAAKRG
jgi:N-acetylglucosaminyldiphosphoundecaprenol N-acetyl-beta-D-mannosaminyltransferase